MGVKGGHTAGGPSLIIYLATLTAGNNLGHF